MARVTIEIYSWLTSLMTGKEQRKASKIILEQEIFEGDRVIDVLDRVVTTEKELGRALFQEESGRLTDQISIAHNNRFIHLLDGENTILNDGDHITLFQAWCGG